MLERKTILDYNDETKQVFDMLTITGDYQIIGSASYKKIKYASDYDLQEFIKEKKGRTILDKIYNAFKDKFISCKEDEDYFITDFKCGLNTDGSPLRWEYKDIMKGYKILDDGYKMKFQDCILIKTMMKLDLIVLVDGIYTEFSENYYFKIGNESNYFNEEQKKEYIEMNILKSLDEYLNVDRNYWKALKRIFSVEMKKTKPSKRLINSMVDFFNGKTGLINKCKNELEIILTVIDNNFRKPDINDIYSNLQIIKHWADDAGLKIGPTIEKMMNKKSLNTLYKAIEKLALKLYIIINKSSLAFLNKKNLI